MARTAAFTKRHRYVERSASWLWRTLLVHLCYGQLSWQSALQCCQRAQLDATAALQCRMPAHLSFHKHSSHWKSRAVGSNTVPVSISDWNSGWLDRTSTRYWTRYQWRPRLETVLLWQMTDSISGSRARLILHPQHSPDWERSKNTLLLVMKCVKTVYTESYCLAFICPSWRW